METSTITQASRAGRTAYANELPANAHSNQREGTEIGPDYTVQQFADLTQVSPRTIQRLIDAGTIYAYKLGRSKRIPASEYPRVRGNAYHPATQYNNQGAA